MTSAGSEKRNLTPCCVSRQASVPLDDAAAFQEGSALHPAAWSITGSDAATEATLTDLIKKVAG
ncbi:MAG TPA: hypothetical protein VFU07_10360 [Candidatus Lumbricidophila sp.]|nr:hypothetical protein [Candidatus Lumbricidophila sp.]